MDELLGQLRVTISATSPQSGAIVAGLLAAIAFILVVVGLRGSMLPCRGRCARCRHELHDPLPQHCGECGAVLAERDAILRGQPRTRRAPFWIGLGLATVAAMGFSLLLAVRGAAAARQGVASRVAELDPEALRELLMASASNDALLDAMEQSRITGVPMPSSVRVDERDMRVWTDVLAAMNEAKLSPAQRRVAAECGARYLEARLAAGSYSSLPGMILEEILLDPPITEEDRIELVRAVAGELTLRAPRVVARGSTAFLIPESRLSRIADRLRDIDVDTMVTAVMLDGVPLEIQRLDRARAGRFGTRTSGQSQVDSVVLDREGVMELQVEIGVSVRKTSIVIGDLKPPGPIATVVHRIEVAPAGEPLPRPIADPRLAPQVREAISVDRLVIAPDLDGQSLVLQAVLRVHALDECALDFDVSLQVGDELVRVGSISRNQRAYEASASRIPHSVATMARSYMFETWVPENAAALERATLVLTPREHMRQGVRGDHFWSLPIEIREIPVSRIPHLVQRERLDTRGGETSGRAR